MNTSTNGTAIRFVSGLALALVTCLASGCDDKIQKPMSDSTPPTYSWHVIVKNSTDQYEYETSGQTLHLGKRYEYYVSFVVDDLDGGVMRIARKGEGQTACPAMSPQPNFPLPPINESNVLQPDADGNVKTTAVLGGWIDATCKHQPGLWPQVISGPGGSIQFSGEGENYFGGKVTSTLTIVSDPL